MVVQHFSVADKVFGDPISIPGSDGEPPTLSTGEWFVLVVDAVYKRMFWYDVCAIVAVLGVCVSDSKCKKFFRLKCIKHLFYDSFIYHSSSSSFLSGKSGVTGPVRISGRANPTSNNNTTTTDNPLHGNSLHGSSGKGGGNNSPKSSSAQDKKSTTTNPISNGAGNNSSGKGDAVDPPSSLALLQQMPPGK